MRVLLALVFAVALQGGDAFSVPPSALRAGLIPGASTHASFAARGPAACRGARPSLSVIASIATSEAEQGSDAEQQGAGEAASAGLPGERFLVFNRFNTRASAPPKFERRWANRKSSLATLPGFRFFSLLRRVDQVAGVDKEYPEGTPNYMSMTVWEDKKSFEGWRKGPAFKEAHGGGTVGGVLSAIVGVAVELKKMPKPALWEGLIPETVPVGGSLIGLKQRDSEGRPEADGKMLLPEECFVAMNRMTALPGKGPELEKYWRDRETTLATTPGFVGFSFLRKNAAAAHGGKSSLPDDIYNYSTCTVWASKEHFEGWRAKHFAETEKRREARGGGAGFAELLDGKPSAVYWEGTQVIQSEVGF